VSATAPANQILQLDVANQITVLGRKLAILFSESHCCVHKTHKTKSKKKFIILFDINKTKMSSLLERPLLKRKSSEHQSVPVDPFHPDAKSFLQQQHTLPKMPLPSLVNKC
jgi:hypothetical protein